MELALELGMPAEALARQMTHREFGRWVMYARRYTMPARRLELYMAQVAWAISRFMGGSDAPISEFILDFGAQLQAEEEQGVPDLDAAIKAFDFRPRRRHRVRKKKPNAR